MRKTTNALPSNPGCITKPNITADSFLPIGGHPVVFLTGKEFAHTINDGEAVVSVCHGQ